MPKVPNLLQRIRDRIMAPSSASGVQPVQSVQSPAQATPQVTSADDEVSPGLWNRIRQRIQQVFQPGAPETKTKLPVEKPDTPTMHLLIRQAGRTKTLLLLRYSSVWRHVEPYSYRRSNVDGELDFFCYCRLHDSIHRLKMKKIQGLMSTDEIFSPRWAVEVG